MIYEILVVINTAPLITTTPKESFLSWPRQRQKFIATQHLSLCQHMTTSTPVPEDSFLPIMSTHDHVDAGARRIVSIR